MNVTYRQSSRAFASARASRVFRRSTSVITFFRFRIVVRLIGERRIGFFERASGLRRVIIW
jgi:hypothetical protein